MPDSTANYNLTTYDRTIDSPSLFIDFRDTQCGTGVSNMKKIDDQMKINADSIGDLAGVGRGNETVKDNYDSILNNASDISAIDSTIGNTILPAVSFFTSTGINSYSLNTGGSFTIGIGKVVNVYFSNKNTGASTINIDGSGIREVKIRLPDGTLRDVLENELFGELQINYDGTYYVVVISAILERFNNLPLDAKYYGAKCDGVTNDTSAIQAILDSSNTAYIPTGVCMVESIIIKQNTTIKMGLTAQIKQIDNTVGHIISVDNNVSDAILQGLKIDGNKDNQTVDNNGIVVNASCSNISIRDCRIENVKYDGIYMRGSDISAQNNFIHNCGRLGIGVGDDATRIKISENNIDTTNNSSINYIGGNISHILIDNNFCRNSGDDGVTGYNGNATDVTVTNNIIKTPFNNGIHIGGSRLLVKNNQIDTPTNRGIYIQNADVSIIEDCQVIGNNITETNSIHGIMIVDASNILIKDNVVRNTLVGRGISLGGCEFANVEGNHVIDNLGDGINLETVEKSIVSGNIVTGNSNGVRVSTSLGDDISFYDNLIMSNTNRGLWIEVGDYHIITGNNVSFNGVDNIVAVGANNVIGNNIDR